MACVSCWSPRLRVFLLHFVAARRDRQRGGPAVTKRNNRAAGNAGSCEGVRLCFRFAERPRLKRASQFQKGAHVLSPASRPIDDP